MGDQQVVPGTPAAVLDEVSSTVFASLPRRDQRRRGHDYLRGLLGATGRKSVRNIAMLIGDEAAEQSLHHFISSSTWDWEPVRQALAGYLVQVAKPRAWVVRPITIPKAGEHSVGVSRKFCATRGQTLNAQHAVGVWIAGEEFTGPVNWRLHLPDAWLADHGRRSQAAIPDGADAETLSGCALAAFLDTAEWRDMPRLPVLLDGRNHDLTSTVRALAGTPFLIRVAPGFALTTADPALPGHSTEPLPCHQVMRAARNLRRQVAVPGRGSCFAATLQVRLPDLPGQRFSVLGIDDPGRAGTDDLWLTNLTGARLPELVHLTGLLRQVDHDSAGTAEKVGIRDYTGRSFTGWHRHVTLASAAHAVASLRRLGRRNLTGVLGHR
ncbi:IS701 family transposase [Lentzea sp. NPDC055074]